MKFNRNRQGLFRSYDLASQSFTTPLVTIDDPNPNNNDQFGYPVAGSEFLLLLANGFRTLVPLILVQLRF